MRRSRLGPLLEGAGCPKGRLGECSNYDRTLPQSQLALCQIFLLSDCHRQSFIQNRFATLSEGAEGAPAPVQPSHFKLQFIVYQGSHPVRGKIIKKVTPKTERKGGKPPFLYFFTRRARRSCLVLKCRSRLGTISRHTSAAVKPPLYRHMPPWSSGTVVTMQKWSMAASMP